MDSKGIRGRSGDFRYRFEDEGVEHAVPATLEDSDERRAGVDGWGVDDSIENGTSKHVSWQGTGFKCAHEAQQWSSSCCA